MLYHFLIDSYATERLKVLSVWSEFRDDDLSRRPSVSDSRGRNVHEHMVHQCMSEDTWFRTMLGIDVGAPPLPQQETRLAFMKGLIQHQAPTIYAYPGLEELLDGERAGGTKAPLPGVSAAGGRPVTQRPTP